MTAHHFLLRITLPCLVLSCCAPLSRTTPEQQALTLATEEQRDCKSAHVTFPAGSYQPEMTSKQGTYYLAPQDLRVTGVLLGSHGRGGIFVAQRGWQAAWFGDHRDEADGHASTLFEAVGASAPKLYPLAPPLPLTPTPKP